jgi:hypothetical protein
MVAATQTLNHPALKIVIVFDLKETVFQGALVIGTAHGIASVTMIHGSVIVLKDFLGQTPATVKK